MRACVCIHARARMYFKCQVLDTLGKLLYQLFTRTERMHMCA